jgi:hypothetical protein
MADLKQAVGKTIAETFGRQNPNLARVCGQLLDRGFTEAQVRATVHGILQRQGIKPEQVPNLLWVLDMWMTERKQAKKGVQHGQLERR